MKYLHNLVLFGEEKRVCCQSLSDEFDTITKLFTAILTGQKHEGGKVKEGERWGKGYGSGEEEVWGGV